MADKLKDFVKRVQIALRDAGHYKGPVDGDPGPLTNKALGLAFPKSLSTTGEGDREPWITAMLPVFGLHEVEDKAKLAKWLVSDGKTLGDPAQLPWCGDAAETAIKLSLPLEAFPRALGENPYWALNWKLFGIELTNPVLNCVGVFDRPGPGAHVGFVVGEDDKEWYVLGGNQGNRLNVSRLKKGRELAFRWPSTYKGPRRPLPRMTPGSTPVSRNEF